MLRKKSLMMFSLLLAACMVVSLFSPLQTVTHAQQGVGLDRTQIPTGTPEGESASFPDSGEVYVMVELIDPPTVKAYLKARDNRSISRTGSQAQEDPGDVARASKVKIEAAQKRVVTHLGNLRRKANVLYRVQSAYNGIAARVDARDIAIIKAHPDVKAVRPLAVQTIENSTSVPFIKAMNAWVAGLGTRGEGMRIGIIDTGIDYLHTDFGGPGTGYSTNNRTIIEPGTFPTAKVVGGKDFVGDAYDAGSTNPAIFTPVPDADPLDCNGHGTHVSGTAAGFGVNSDGTTYAGSYDTATAFSSLRVGPGVAPKALLYALKVFGCTGSTVVTTQAIDFAVDPDGNGDPSDHLDVINMSLGSNFGSPDDASAAASTNAAAAGVIVCAASGNAGDTTYITSSPGSSLAAINVANIVDDGIAGAILNVTSPADIAGGYTGGTGAFGPTTGSYSGQIVQALDAANASGPLTTDGCTGITNGGAIAGKIALMDRGTCNFTVKVKNAQLAGAIAAVIVSNVVGPTAGMGGTDPTITIPSVMISVADGNKIKAKLAASAVVNGTINFTTAADTVSVSSSRGPRRADSGVKPEISAPGTTITSAGMGTGTGTLTISGTSMATPHIAGSMALLRQLHPTWTVEELKALIMNTATHDLYNAPNSSPPIYGVARIGAGRVDLLNASSTDVVAMNADNAGAVAVSFGAPEVVGSATLTKTVKVVNKGVTSATYDISYQSATDVPGVTISVPSSITVPAGSTMTFQVTLNANAAAMKHPLDPTMFANQGSSGAGFPRHYLAEKSGYVTLTPASGTTLRVPVYAAARPASAMSTLHNYLLFTGATGSITVGLTGTGVNTGASIPVDEISVVSALELQEVSPNDTTANSTGIGNNADLKAIGVTSDYKATNSIAGRTVFFGIATHGNWSTLSEVTFNIFIDRDRNGTDDFQVLTTTVGNGANLDPSDIFVTAVRALPAGALALSSFVNGATAGLDTVPFNTNVIVLPVSAASIGLTAANTKFNYRITTSSRFIGSVDASATHTYDLANPGLDLTGGVSGATLYNDLNGATIPVNYNKANFQAANSLGLLLLHHHNATGAHDQILTAAEPTSTTTTVDAAAGQYSDPVTLKATVSPATYLDQTVSGNVQFSVDSVPVGSPVAVNASGVATTSYTITGAAGPHTIKADFTSTNSAFLNSSGTGTLTVSKENANVTPSGTNPDAVKVNTAGGTAGPVTICFNINEVNDGSAGDTTNATPVSFTMTPIGGGAPVTAASINYSGGGVGATRTACATFNNVPVNVYEVTATIGGNYYQGSGTTILTVYDPSLGFVTGGGSIIHNGVKANFGVNIKYLKSGNAQGSLIYVEHRATGDVVLKSNSLGNMAIVGNEAKPTGKASLNGVGNYSFIARIIDNGEPGANDQFGLRVTDPNGVIVVDLTFDPIQLSGGNVQVPKQTGK